MQIFMAKLTFSLSSVRLDWSCEHTEQLGCEMVEQCQDFPTLCSASAYLQR